MYDGRPEDTAGRLEKEIRVYNLLDSLQIPYKRVDHAAANTMEACKAIDETLKCTICKNLFLCNRQQTRFYLLMIPDTKKFKTKDISAQINSSRGCAERRRSRLSSVHQYIKPESKNQGYLRKIPSCGTPRHDPGTPVGENERKNKAGRAYHPATGLLLHPDLSQFIHAFVLV